MNKTLLIASVVLIPALFLSTGHAVYPVSDETAHAISIQNFSDEIAKLNEGLQKTQQLINYAEQARAIAGDPAKALGALSGMTGITAGDDLGKSLDQIADIAGTANNLSSRVQKLYRPLDLQNPLNSIKSSNPYAPFQAVESAYSQYDYQLKNSQAAVKAIRKSIDNVNKRTATTEAEQRQKQADLAALQAKLADAQKEESDAFHALEAQKTLNDSMAEKEAINNQQAAKQRLSKALGK